jgi:hypothetical protein
MLVREMIKKKSRGTDSSYIVRAGNKIDREEMRDKKMGGKGQGSG